MRNKEVEVLTEFNKRTGYNTVPITPEKLELFRSVVNNTVKSQGFLCQVAFNISTNFFHKIIYSSQIPCPDALISCLPIQHETPGNLYEGYFLGIVWFQKISIPPPRREFHIGPPHPPGFSIFKVFS